MASIDRHLTTFQILLSHRIVLFAWIVGFCSCGRMNAVKGDWLESSPSDSVAWIKRITSDGEGFIGMKMFQENLEACDGL